MLDHLGSYQASRGEGESYPIGSPCQLTPSLPAYPRSLLLEIASYCIEVPGSIRLRKSCKVLEEACN